MRTQSILLLFSLKLLFAQGNWVDGNLKNLDSFSLNINLKGIEDEAWLKRLNTLFELKFSEENIFFGQETYPKLVIDIQVIDSRVEKISSYLITWALYDYSVPQEKYFQSIADGTITKQMMISRIYSSELLGQTNSKSLYGDVEKSLGKLFNQFVNNVQRDNPLKQF